MSGGGEIIGDIAQGALTARAFEPSHGEAADGHTHERACLNCGTVLIGSHCHACGQAAHVHRTLSAFFHDLLHGVFHFEGKVWRTLPLLAWQPGQLTREYIDGKRASYVSPIALFLFVVFLTFAVFNLLGSPIDFGNRSQPQVAKGVSDAKAEAQADVAKAEQELAAARAAGRPTDALERKVKGARMAVETIEAAQGGKLPKAIANSDDPGEDEWVQVVNETWAKARENPELVVYKLQQSAYKYSWLLIPLSVPFVWLLFPFSRRFHLYDHTVFVTYSLSFMLLLLATMSVVAVWGNGGFLLGVLLFYAPFHMYRQLRGAYGLTRFGAWWRTWFLSFFAVVVLVLFATAMTALVAAE